MADDETPPSKPPCNREDALAVLRRLRDAGHVAYFAGGCVRDLLLGREPKDWDVATDAPPGRVRELFSNTQAVGQAFGVILVRHRRSQVEVATFRTDGSYTDGRRPDAVRFATAEEDARRRDFTINGLFLDPVEDRVIDYVGGREDLAAGSVRAIGDPDRRFEEDHLRLLRAVRFAARLAFVIEPATAAAIRRHAPLLVRISPERIAEELRHMFGPPTRAGAWVLLWELALVDPIFRHLGSAEGAELDPARSVFLAVDPATTIPFGLALAAAAVCFRMKPPNGPKDVRALLDRGEVQRIVRALRQGLKISNDEAEQVRAVLEGIRPLLGEESPGVAAMKRFLAGPHAREARMLLDALAKVGQHVGHLAELRPKLEELSRGDVAPPPLITGDDLTAAALEPGPVFKRVLDSVYDAQLEGRVTTREEAMELAMRVAKQ